MNNEENTITNIRDDAEAVTRELEFAMSSVEITSTAPAQRAPRAKKWTPVEKRRAPKEGSVWPPLPAEPVAAPAVVVEEPAERWTAVGQQRTPEASSWTPLTADKPRAFVQTTQTPKVIVSPTRKPQAVFAQPKVSKHEALEVAQQTFVHEIVSSFQPEMVEMINRYLSHFLEYRKLIVVSFDDDTIKVNTHTGDSFDFSRKHFFENKVFSWKLKEEMLKLIPEGWFKFFLGRDPNSFCIGISKNKHA